MGCGGIGREWMRREGKSRAGGGTERD